MIDLRPDLLEMVVRVLHEHVPRCEVWAFGSRVQGNAKKFSDLDLAVHATDVLSFKVLGELREAFSESDLPITVDVIDFNRVSTEFQEVIRENHVVVSQ